MEIMTNHASNKPSVLSDATSQPALAPSLPSTPLDQDNKSSKGVFKTKQRSIRRSKDPHTFKCSICETHASTPRELNAHYIANHRNVNCDICQKAFSTPGTLKKHNTLMQRSSHSINVVVVTKYFLLKVS